MMMKARSERRLKGIIGMLFLLIAAMAAAALFSGCATSKTASVQSAPFSYQQGVSEDGQQDFIHLTVHVLFRDVPEKGATTRFATALGQVLNDLNVIGAVTSIGSQPERMLSRLEDGKRAHISIPIKVPLSEGRDTEIDISTDEIRQAAQSALEEVELDNVVEGIHVTGININIKSTMAD